MGIDFNSFLQQSGEVSDTTTIQSGITAFFNFLLFLYGLIVKAAGLVLESYWWFVPIIILTFIVDWIFVGRILWQKERTLKRMAVSFLIVMLLFTVFGFVLLPIFRNVVNYLQFNFGGG